MSKYASYDIFENDIVVNFNAEDEKVKKVTEKIKENSYAQSYDWNDFFDFYLSKKNPNLHEELKKEHGNANYLGKYRKSLISEDKANKLVDLLNQFVDSEEDTYNFFQQYGNEMYSDK